MMKHDDDVNCGKANLIEDIIVAVLIVDFFELICIEWLYVFRLFP